MNSGEESALPMVSSLISSSCKYEGLVSLDCSWRKISVVSGKWKSSMKLGLSSLRGPDSSLAEVDRESCSEDIHMEEEKVEIRVQEDEVEDVRDK